VTQTTEITTTTTPDVGGHPDVATSPVIDAPHAGVQAELEHPEATHQSLRPSYLMTRGPEVLVAIAVLFNLWVLRAERLAVAYPNDLAFHVKMVRAASRLLSHGQSPLTHWFTHLSLGSPLFVQYQSASAILTGSVGRVVGAQQAFTWSLYLLLSLWPLCIYWTARLLGWSRWESGAAGVIAPLIFSVTGRGFEDQAYAWLGSGLWSQLWAMWAMPLAVGFSWRYLTKRQYLFPAVLATSLTIAFHFLIAYLLALILVVLAVLTPSETPRRLGRAALIGGCSMLATLWVTVPLLQVANWTARNEFQVHTPIDDSYGAPRVLSWLVSGKIFDFGRFPIITILVAIGLGYCISRFRRDERARLLVGIFVLSLLLFFGRPTLGFALNLLPGSRVLLFQRFIAGVHFAGILLAGVGAVCAVRLIVAGARRQWPNRRLPFEGGRRHVILGGLVAVALLVGILSPAWRQASAYGELNADWIGYQRVIDTHEGPQLASLVSLAQRRGGGRIYAGLPSNWGYHFFVGGVQVYNYLEDTRVRTMGITLRTFGLMTDPEAWFDQDNPGDYSVFDVRYILAPVTMRTPVFARLLERAGPYALWTVDAGGLFQVVDTTTPISANAWNLGQTTKAFLQSDLPGRGIFPTIAFNGKPAATPTLAPGEVPSGPAGRVLNTTDLVSGKAAAVVDAHRTSVVLLKASYDPGWSVTVDGKPATTEMLAPALIGVQVGPGVHRVAFTYHGYGSYPLVFGIALATLVGVGVGPILWRRRRHLAGEDPPSEPATTVS
jgi:hypothetical protein